MKSSRSRGARYGRNDGQALVLFLFFSIVLILFVGLGLDLGFAYVTKAQLAKALDASSLAAVANYKGGETPDGNTARIIAQNVFYANYATNGVSGRAAGLAPVTPVGNFYRDVNNTLTYTNTATTTINTFFIGLLPQWKTLTVGDTATATRSPVVMTLVLDRTGSMSPGPQPIACVNNFTQGGLYLPGAVTNFISIFDITLDRAALVTFSVSSSNDVRMTAANGDFKTPIINTLTRINNNNLWLGGTCSPAGLTNALQIQNATVVPSNYVKVVVFFTDGRANMTTWRFPTTPSGGILLNFGGRDPATIGCAGQADDGAGGFWRTNTSETAQNSGQVRGFVDCGTTMPAYSVGGGTGTVAATQFIDVTGTPRQFCASHITADSMNRCVRIANSMRDSGNFVYAVGLSAPGALSPPTLDFLQQVANDPDSSTFDQTKPVGAAFVSTGNDLSQVFRQVAADIILRLIQ